MSDQSTHSLAPVEPAPSLGPHGEPCTACGSPLAADQRYCLNCGIRRADTRLAFRDILAAKAAAGAAQPPAGGAASGADAGDSRWGTFAALAGLCALLIALGIGILIGNTGKESVSTPAPQVVTVTGGGATSGSDTSGSGTSSGSSKSTSKSSGSTSKSSKATSDTVKKLDSLTPEQYQKQSQKLPKTVGTGGTAPAPDNKAPAGGGSFDTFE
ncbi:unannotated protein [freshwater metagenome]|uniref:Unannotated protein n=1 Tax=freshwater metagenome TaxID=449393 RepID=A0A6J7HR50_9ZZZZ|nr:hypothetical protein [Actinomycetota bacterium]